MHAGGLVVGSQTTASWIAELDSRAPRHWVTATAAPCTGMFKPVSVGDPLDLGPPPTDRFDPTTLWWRHEVFHRRVVRDPLQSFPTFTAARDRVEEQWWESPPKPVEAFRAADAELVRWIDQVGAPRDRRPWYVRRYWSVRNRRAGLPA
jgi:hypothetical protein